MAQAVAVTTHYCMGKLYDLISAGPFHTGPYDILRA